MAGPVPSIVDVPLRDVLPGECVAEEEDVRRLAFALEEHPSAADRTTWHWYPEHAHPSAAADGEYVLLVDSAITVVDTGQDWLEVMLDIAWRPNLTVSAAVEVACWCPQNHNMHQVRVAAWEAASCRELVEAFAAGAAMVTEVLDSGRFDPRAWRREAGLPDAPAATR